MKPSRICALLPVLLFVACDDETETIPTDTTTTPTATTSGTGVGGTGGTGGGSGGTAGSGGFDLQNGSWALQNASNTADTISHDGALAITSDGTVWIAFSEPDAVTTYDQDIFTTSRSGADFSAAAALTSDTDVQNAYPAMVADGAELHLVWNGYPAVDNDIFYATYDGSWSARADLTSPTEGGTAWDDYKPDLARTPGGDLVVAYLSKPSAGVAEVRVLRLSGGVPTGDPVTIIPAGTDGCWNARVAVDSDGNQHVVAECGALFHESVHYATNRTGSWASEVLAGGAGEQHTHPDIAIGPDGTSVHVVWQNWLGSSDADVYYVVSSGGTFGTPVAVTSTADDTETQPSVAVDALGRPLVMYGRANADGMFDIFVTNSANGESFGPEVNVTPGTDDSDQWMPYALIFHPQTGLPHLTFTEIVPESDPLDTEVYHAEFVPGG